jgi:hypothetical protein
VRMYFRSGWYAKRIISALHWPCVARSNHILTCGDKQLKREITL